ncbi:ATP-binding cassette domain-containing protein [Solirubrobacter ginsenosidimutans]|uniref:ATP-binding cassette domain-containing protein n=1 Tax=Solirubrobacter ginsenosidimutans TaxID=490573 RepID=A0A9X3MPF2_9ACTN|nr:ATP-binding cassette domain-containing protein [Solirubrobacter ginsenosidimutans]MDA0160386.1 ATP-binding cassette domain-containing protein [Solirubrobacter ginsenosidimutans]
MLEIQQLHKVFPNGVVALDGVDLFVPRGEILGVIGRSGTGKSTLIRCINRLEEPTSGSILLDGRDVTRMRGGELRATRRRLGMIFQQFNLLTSRTAAENVALPLEVAGAGRAERRRRALELLALVGLEDRAGSYPSQLSGGQKQRVGIARALAAEPSVLLSDEATSALDSETTDSVLDLLRRINAELGVTVLLITHELDVVRRVCDSVALLDAGRVVESGPLGEVVARTGSALATGLLPSLGRVEVGESEIALDVVLLDDDADERLAAALTDGARVEARATERIGDRRVTRALVVTDDAADAPRLADELRVRGARAEVAR